MAKLFDLLMGVSKVRPEVRELGADGTPAWVANIPCGER
jgi:hypothetical protein